MEKKNLPPDEQRCCHTSGKWRCKNFKMNHGAAAAADDTIPKSRLCEKHSDYYKNYYKKRSEDRLCANCGATDIQTRVSKRTKKEEQRNQPPTCDDNPDRIGRKRAIVERCGEVESLTGIRETVVESESLEHYKSKCFELSVELEKKKLECSTLQSKLLGEVRDRKTLVDAAEYWRKMFSNLESRVLRLENENSTMRCVISNLESLVSRDGKESSALRSAELHNFEKIEPGAWGSQNDVNQSGEKHNTSKPNAETSSDGRNDSHVFELKTKENVLNLHGIRIDKHHVSQFESHNYSASISSGSLDLSNEGDKVEPRNGLGCSKKRPSQHGSSSQDHSEMSTKALVNLVSDDSGECLDESEDSDCSSDSGSLGTLMDMLAMRYTNRNQDKEIKWKLEADMLSSLEKEPELCMKAVCALYRQHISEDEILDKGLIDNSDVVRCTTLAKFLMDEDCKGYLNKSVKELEIFDSKAADDCKRLARRYSTQLFSIYQNRKDPLFLPATTARR